VTPPPTEHLLAEADRREAANTRALMPPRPLALARALGRALRRPGGLVGALREILADARPGRRGTVRALAQAGMALTLWDDLDRKGIHHLHTHFAGTPADVTWMTAVLGQALAHEGERWTWSLTVHGPVEFYDLIEYRLARRVEQATFVVGISDFARSQLMALVEPEQWDKLHVIHCAVDAGVFEPAAGGGENGRLEVLNIARLVAVKGQAVLIEAVAELVARGRDVHLTVVGDGALRASLEALAAEKGVSGQVTFTGPVGQDHIREHYRRADVFCLSSFAEGVPVVLMEAMAMEIPVVATRIAGISELIEDDVDGLLVRPARADRLADALDRLAGDAELRARLGRHGREKVMAEFSPASSAEELSRLLEAAVRPNGGTAA
jgi:glycosyltransferase involved in cell wall biosynthesis